jgi:hypothetical protein
MPTQVYFTGGPSITVEEDFDQVQQRLEHEAGYSRWRRLPRSAIESASTGQRLPTSRRSRRAIRQIPRGKTLPLRDDALLELSPPPSRPRTWRGAGSARRSRALIGLGLSSWYRDLTCLRTVGRSERDEERTRGWAGRGVGDRRGHRHCLGDPRPNGRLLGRCLYRRDLDRLLDRVTSLAQALSPAVVAASRGRARP